jgi:hypothetical protein
MICALLPQYVKPDAIDCQQQTQGLDPVAIKCAP